MHGISLNNGLKLFLNYRGFEIRHVAFKSSTNFALGQTRRLTTFKDDLSYSKPSLLKKNIFEFCHSAAFFHIYEQNPSLQLYILLGSEFVSQCLHRTRQFCNKLQRGLVLLCPRISLMKRQSF